MTFFAGLRLLWDNLPAILGAIKALGAAVEAGVHHFEVKIALQTFDKAAKLAEEKKDTSELESIFNPKPGSGDDSHG